MQFPALVTLLLTITPAIVLAQQNFSCSYGTRGACLGYNDKIVDRSAACFTEYACDFKGFICKSKFDSVVDDRDALVVKYNDLLRRNRDLAETAKSVVDRNETLTTEYDELITKFRRLAAEHETQGSELRTAQMLNMQLISRGRTSPSPDTSSPTAGKKK